MSKIRKRICENPPHTCLNGVMLAPVPPKKMGIGPTSLLFDKSLHGSVVRRQKKKPKMDAIAHRTSRADNWEKANGIVPVTLLFSKRLHQVKIRTKEKCRKHRGLQTSHSALRFRNSRMSSGIDPVRFMSFNALEQKGQISTHGGQQNAHRQKARPVARHNLLASGRFSVAHVEPIFVWTNV